MDSSNNIGDAEECSSNESGWTMYIASPVHEKNPDEDDDDSNGGSGSERKEYKDFHDHNHHSRDGESDDSMASDASSGPSHQGPRGTYKRNHGKYYSEHAGSKDNRRSSANKQYKQVEQKGRAQKPKAEEEEHGRKVRSSTADVYSKGKSRKNK